MLNSDELVTTRINNKKVVFKINKKYGTLKVNDIFFPSIGNVKKFINKLSDIVEEMESCQEEFIVRD